MTAKHQMHRRAVAQHLSMWRDLGLTIRRRLAPDHPVSLFGDSGLVDDGIEHLRRDVHVLAPLAREDMTGVDLPFVARQRGQALPAVEGVFEHQAGGGSTPKHMLTMPL